LKPKYWVPAISRANDVIHLVARYPGKFRLIDLSQELEISKSSIYSLLNTLEHLSWLRKTDKETYTLGPFFGTVGTLYLHQFDILDAFLSEAKRVVSIVDEHIQLGRLVGDEVYYMAREEGSSPVRLVTDPGNRFPAYASGLGKVLLSQYDYEQLKDVLAETTFEKKTPSTVSNIDELWEEIKKAKEQGYITDEEEGAKGFYCVAAPIYDSRNEITAAVSFTMLESSWKKKQELATKEIQKLAKVLSLNENT
jgi:IclR family transcriptional regulator, KDG regulon repressor